MGAYLSTPCVDKDIDEGKGENGHHYVVGDMQGWRKNHEDAHICSTDIYEDDETTAVTKTKNGIALYAVFDGHGGKEVAKYCQYHVVEELKELESFKRKDYEAALRELFHHIDRQLENPDSEDELVHYRKISNPSDLSQTEKDRKALAAAAGNSSKIIHNSERFVPHNESASKALKGRKTSDIKADYELHGSAQPSTIVESSEGGPIAVPECTRENKKKDLISSSEALQLFHTLLLKESSKAKGSGAEKTPGSAFISRVSDSDAAGKDAEEIDDSDEKEEEKGEADDDSDEQEREDSSALNGAANVCVVGGSSGPKTEEERDEEQKVQTTDENSSGMTEGKARPKRMFASLIRDDGVFTCTLPDHRVGAGCTAVVCLAVGRTLYVANAGDSRAVLCRDGEAYPLSFDHKPSQPRELQRIEAAGGFVNNVGRINDNLNLSRSIGDLKYKQVPGVAPENQIITAEPDITVTELTPSDEFVIIGCDGIWDVLTSQTAVDFVRTRLALDMSMKEIIEEVLDHCVSVNPRKTNGIGGDNMTCIIVKF